MKKNTTDVLINEFQSTRLCNRVKHFYKSFNFATLANKSNIRKDAGVLSFTLTKANPTT